MPVNDDPRWDSEMLAIRRRMDERAAQHPPVLLAEPLDAHRVTNDALNLPLAEGGPVMAETSDRWVFARGRRVLCRLHRPRTDAVLPVLVWFHGGGWVWSSVDTHDRLVREYAAAGDVAVVNVDYALSPEAKFPQALMECAAVVRFLAAEGASWGVDPSRMLVGGDSAGGNLALATALHLRDSGGPALRGILAAYPVAAPDFSTPSYEEFDQGYGLTAAGMEAYWNLYLRDVADRRNPLAAPLLADHAGMPPTLIQLAELDVLRSEGERLAEKMQAAGVAVTSETIPGVAHGFMRLTGHVARAREAVARAGTWLRGVAA
jgi:acetyl esterase